MPNWCQNTLTVEGADAQVRHFVDTNRNTADSDKDQHQLSFENLAPTPPELLDGEGWYNWRVSNWGTKWDASDTTEWTYITNAIGDTSAVLNFDTAWSPPIGWLALVGRHYPELTLTLAYVEHGMGFTGIAVAEDGNLDDIEAEYEAPDEDDPDLYF